MNKTMKLFCITAFTLLGAVMISCQSQEEPQQPQQPKQPQQQVQASNIVTLKATVSMSESADEARSTTRALTSSGGKTFAVNDQIAVIYKNTSGVTVKATSAKLISSDILEESKSAQFTVTLENPDYTKNVTYIYPAAMAKSDGTANYEALATQDGILDNLASNLDYCQSDDTAWDDTSLPTASLKNKLAICAFTIKNSDGSDITNTITNMTINDGSKTYTISRAAASGPIYVAIQPVTASLEIYATATGSNSYVKGVVSREYAAKKWYNFTVKMLKHITGKFTVNSSGDKVYFSPSNLNATTSNNGTTWTWHFVSTQYARVGGRSSGGSEARSGNNLINGNGTVSDEGNGMNIDLFGWSTDKYLGIKPTNNNNDQFTGTFNDWGKASEVTACIGTGWRTLTSNEWRYLMVTRGGNRFAKAAINGTRKGFILLPDDWKTSYYPSLSTFNDANAAFLTISDSKWPTLEAYGAVFLPVTGQRNGSNYVNGYDDQLHYWSATKGDTETGSGANANHLRYMDSGDYKGLAPDTGAGRCNGFSVRLVRDVK